MLLNRAWSELWEYLWILACGLSSQNLILKRSLWFLQVLNRTGDPTGAHIILMSDGEENRKPYISEIFPELKKMKVIVSTIAIGLLADVKLESIALSTKGSSYFIDETVNALSSSLKLAFFETTSTHLDPANRPVVVSTRDSAIISAIYYWWTR